MKKFKTSNGNIIDNVTEYVKKWLEENKDYLPIESDNATPIYVGTNSSGQGKFHKYTTVIALRKMGKGIHVLYSVERNKVMDAFSKLYKEVEMSINVARSLVDSGILIESDITIHLDLNPKIEYSSNQVHDAGVGMVKGMGFKVESKPGAWAASHATQGTK